MKINMTLEEKVGQLFFVRCPGGERALEHIDKFAPGGYLLFGADFKDSTPETLRETLKSYQSRTKIPMFIGSDDEGGTVTRSSYYPQFRPTRFLSPMNLLKCGGTEALLADVDEKSAFLQSLGINVNFAPVCDMSSDETSFIYPRTLGLSAKETARVISLMVTRMKSAGIGSMLKHFPGYGENSDTHIGLSVDNRDWEELSVRDLLPFAAGIAAGVDSVLVSHNIIATVDAKYPASLSLSVHSRLREELGFGGVVITDDLQMDAISRYTDGEEAAVRAVMAGNDMLCASDYEVGLPAVIRAVKRGLIDESSLDTKLDRIFVWKRSLGLI